jgi:cytochrome b561
MVSLETRAAFTSTDPRYTAVSVVLHWLLAGAIAGVFAIGLYMTGLSLSPRRFVFFSMHKWAGVCILAMSAIRLLWRLAHPPPELLPMKPWQRRGAHAVHGMLYGLSFVVPLMGWAYSNAAGHPVVLFGFLPMPAFVPVDKELAVAFKIWHHWLAYAMAALVAGHMAGALKHAVIDRDTTLRRMAIPLRSRNR